MNHTQFRTALSKIRQRQTHHAVGKAFEEAIQTYFEQDPIHSDRFEKVQGWTKFQHSAELEGVLERTEGDRGIDIVAKLRNRDGHCVAQVKCYKDDHKLSENDIKGFTAKLGELERHPNQAIDPVERYFIHTCEYVTDNAIDHAKKMGVRLIGPADLEASEIEWHVSGEAIVPEKLPPRQLRPHQKKAVDAAVRHFTEGRQDRGRMKMACGTGKTFTALRIAEHIGGEGGRILVAVPSLALLSQTWREWRAHRSLPHHYIAVGSDKTVGRSDDVITDISVDVTTDPKEIASFLREDPGDRLMVVFSTYQSLPQVAAAQDVVKITFDLAIADEAHRTTGAEVGDEVNAFQIFHASDRICAQHRLYMTATPKIYGEAAKTRARSDNVGLYTMDDETIYGAPIYEYGFRKAVEDEQLCDYKVVVMQFREEDANRLRAMLDMETSKSFQLTDVAKTIALMTAICDPQDPDNPDVLMKRVIPFWGRIARSDHFHRFWNEHFSKPLESQIEGIAEKAGPHTFHAMHVDGRMSAAKRAERIEVLRQGGLTSEDREDTEHTVLLSNARVLGEGVDVPALDAIAFMDPKQQPNDVVQAVGRAMRPDPSGTKQMAYIIVPVAIPAGVAPEDALNDSETYKVVWSVLRALRSHDELWDAEVNALLANKRPSKRIIFADGAQWLGLQLPEGPIDIPADAMVAKIAEKCGDASYWPRWAKDIGRIFERVRAMCQEAWNRDDNLEGKGPLAKAFERTAKQLGQTIGEDFGAKRVTDIVAQHIVVRRVLDAIFPDQRFIEASPVARALDRLAKRLEQSGIGHELAQLESMYESITRAAGTIEDHAGRQELLQRVYQDFIAQAFPKEKDAMGVVYTPVEVVDFINRSVDDLLYKHFGERLTSEGVHVLDPFTGTGTFIVRMLASGLIQQEDLVRKYTKELHANEIMLLPYYIALLNITNAAKAAMRTSGLPEDEIATQPVFPGGVYVDSLSEAAAEKAEHNGLFEPDEQDWSENAKKKKRQDSTDIRVILGNPPYRGGQDSANDMNPNPSHPTLEKRAKETYGAKSKSRGTQSIYNLYKLAMRWTTDRMGQQGVMAYITGDSWFNGKGNDGLRACLEEEFDTIYVVDFGGKEHTHNIFGNKTANTIIIALGGGGGQVAKGLKSQHPCS